jgi:hypothetical protein
MKTLLLPQSTPVPENERISDMTEPQDSLPPATPAEAVAPAPRADADLKKKKGLAIASLVCGIIGGWASTVSIPAVICGHMALRKIKKNPETYTGKGLAISGLVLGYLGLVLAVVTGFMRGMLKGQLNSMGY